MEDSVIGKYLKLIDKRIYPNTQYLYKLQTYIGEKENENLWDFNNKIQDYKEFGFQNIDELLLFCNNKWQIIATDFKQISDTNIPS